ncbi:MAG: hypothetical protein ACREIT_07605, partial [Tepidisphaeraceae bacterium]
KLITKFYNTMVSTELKGKAPPVLTYNVFAYCMGPVILSLIPYVGPILAAASVLALLIVAGKARLHLTTGNAIVAPLISTLGAVAIIAGIYLAGWYLWSFINDGGAIQRPKPLSGSDR